MSIADIHVAKESFAIDATMSAEDINIAVAKLAMAVQKVADSYTADVTTGDAGDEAQTRADTLEGIVSELENIDVEVDSECTACDGEGTVECRGSGGSCPGDETCAACKGEGSVDCPKCNGTGEIDSPTVTSETIQEVTAAVVDAMQQLPPT